MLQGGSRGLPCLPRAITASLHHRGRPLGLCSPLGTGVLRAGSGHRARQLLGWSWRETEAGHGVAHSPQVRAGRAGCLGGAVLMTWSRKWSCVARQWHRQLPAGIPPSLWPLLCQGHPPSPGTHLPKPKSVVTRQVRINQRGAARCREPLDPKEPNLPMVPHGRGCPWVPGRRRFLKIMGTVACFVCLVDFAPKSPSFSFFRTCRQGAMDQGSCPRPRWDPACGSP